MCMPEPGRQSTTTENPIQDLLSPVWKDLTTSARNTWTWESTAPESDSSISRGRRRSKTQQSSAHSLHCTLIPEPRIKTYCPRWTTGRTHSGRWAQRVVSPPTQGKHPKRPNTTILNCGQDYGKTSNQGTEITLISRNLQTLRPPAVAPLRRTTLVRISPLRGGKTWATSHPPHSRIPSMWHLHAQTSKRKESQALRNSSSFLNGSARVPGPPGVREGLHWRNGAGGTISGRSHLQGRTKGSSSIQALQLRTAASLRWTTALCMNSPILLCNSLNNSPEHTDSNPNHRMQISLGHRACWTNPKETIQLGCMFHRPRQGPPSPQMVWWWSQKWFLVHYRELHIPTSRGTQSQTVRAERRIISYCYETYRRYQDYRHILGCNAGENIDNYWNVDGDRDLLDKMTGFTRFTVYWTKGHLMGRHGPGGDWQENKRPPGQTLCVQRFWKICPMRRDAKKSKSGLSKNRSSTMPEDCVVFTSLNLMMENSKIPWRMHVGKLEVPMPAAMPCKLQREKYRKPVALTSAR